MTEGGRRMTVGGPTFQTDGFTGIELSAFSAGSAFQWDRIACEQAPTGQTVGT
jgi:hypothetical protein